MKAIFPLTALAALALSIPSVATAAKGELANGDKANSEREICKTETITGSRLAKRKVCRTAAQWQKYQQDTSDNFEQARRRIRAAQDNQ